MGPRKRLVGQLFVVSRPKSVVVGQLSACRSRTTFANNGNRLLATGYWLLTTSYCQRTTDLLQISLFVFVNNVLTRANGQGHHRQGRVLAAAGDKACSVGD